MRRIFSLIVLHAFIYLASFSNLMSQVLDNEFTIDVEWSSPQSHNINNQEVLVPNALDLVIDNFKPKFFWRKKIKSKNFSIQILNIETEQSLTEEKSYLKRFYDQISTEVELETNVTNSRNESYALIDFVPFVERNGQILRVKSIMFRLI